MEIRSIASLVLGISVLSFSFASSAAEEYVGFYTNGQWDPACSTCWPSPRTASNNHCTPKDCAIQGYYHCKMQKPRLAIDDDPRLISLIKSGECVYAPRAAMSQDELAYVDSIKMCSTVLDKMAGRFVMPENEKAAKMRMDFYLTNFKASILGSANDQLKLAIDYDIGLGIQQNRLKATEHYIQAAKMGAPFAQYAVAARYAYGISLEKDSEKALSWLHKVLSNKPITQADKQAQSIVTPCAIQLVERLTPT